MRIHRQTNSNLFVIAGASVYCSHNLEQSWSIITRRPASIRYGHRRSNAFPPFVQSVFRPSIYPTISLLPDPSALPFLPLLSLTTPPSASLYRHHHPRRRHQITTSLESPAFKLHFWLVSVRIGVMEAGAENDQKGEGEAKGRLFTIFD